MDKEVIVYDEKMKKTIAAFESELSTIRVGRANPRVLDKITVDYYGTPTPINQIGNITVPEARLLQIQPWDASMIKQVEKAIQASELGINPSNDGKVIRLMFPELTEDRRKEITKDVKKKGEEAKIALRNIRRDALEQFKKQEKKSEITEDDYKELEADMQKLTEKYTSDLDKIVDKKNKEVLSV